ncbi:MAG: hypothetical protein H6592_01620 [Flavobacteriales bacterium]|nr:hypothetical protein [Flavobacteriales bacterium]
MSTSLLHSPTTTPSIREGIELRQLVLRGIAPRRVQELSASPRRYALRHAAWIAFTVLAPASGFSQKPTSLDAGSIPKEFTGYQGTLLIELQNSRKWDGRAQKAFTQEYRGPVKFVQAQEVGSYEDTENYRFLLSRDRYVKEIGGFEATTYYERLRLVDRTTGTSTSSPSTDFEGQLLKTYAKELERMRKR